MFLVEQRRSKLRKSQKPVGLLFDRLTICSTLSLYSPSPHPNKKGKVYNQRLRRFLCFSVSHFYSTTTSNIKKNPWNLKLHLLLNENIKALSNLVWKLQVLVSLALPTREQLINNYCWMQTEFRKVSILCWDFKNN